MIKKKWRSVCVEEEEKEEEKERWADREVVLCVRSETETANNLLTLGPGGGDECVRLRADVVDDWALKPGNSEVESFINNILKPKVHVSGCE